MGIGLANRLVENVFSTPEMRALFDDQAMLQGWLDTEKALATVQADIGDIPKGSVKDIANACKASDYSVDELASAILETGHPLVPVIRKLVEKSGDAGRYVHWGATTQDIVDTGMVLQCRDGLKLLLGELSAVISEFVVHAETYRSVPMAGRTHFQHAAPITLGYKIAIWIDDLLRVRARITTLIDQLTGQFAGAVGTLAALDGNGFETRDRMCAELGLKSAEVPWHTSRDRVREIVNALLEIASAAERIGVEIVLLQATELQEASEPISDKHVGSSTMPQKRNPHTSEFMIAAARMMRGCAMPITVHSAHPHERDMTSWALEWIAVPQLFSLASGVCRHLRHISEGMTANPDNMRRVLDMTKGLIMSESVMMKLAKHIGHEVAHEIVFECAGKAAKQDSDLGDILKADKRVLAHLSEAEINAALDPAGYLGDSEKIVDAAVQSARAIINSEGE